MAITLSDCQNKALSLLEGEQNVFLTGVAGSGKSTLLRHFLRDKDPQEYPVLASTGAAAILIGGRTFHSFFGLGIMDGGIFATVESAGKNSRVRSRLRKAKALVIDEISMLTGDAWEAAEMIARKAKNSSAAWGGLQVIAVGDFAQLPPVSSSGTSKSWLFRSSAWEMTGFHAAVLRTIMRQEDAFFLKILNEVRHGQWSEDLKDFLEERTLRFSPEFEGTRLFPRRDQTDRYNLTRLAELPGPLEEYPSEYSGEARAVESLKKQAPVGERLQLKEGALVMIRVNDPRGRYVNGSLGRYRGLDSEKKLEIELLRGTLVRLEMASFSFTNADGEPVAVARNYPVNLAWGTTIHKAQGATFDKLSVDLRSLWEPGQAYVALSRVRAPEGLAVEGWSQGSFRVSPEVLAFHESIGFTN